MEELFREEKKETKCFILYKYWSCTASQLTSMHTKFLFENVVSVNKRLVRLFEVNRLENSIR